MIAVTGIGMVSTYGVGKEAFLSGLREGKGIGNGNHNGTIKDFIPKKFISPMKARRMSRFSQLALISALEGWKDSSIQGHYDPMNIGVIVGTGLGSVSSTDSYYVGLLERGPEETNPMLFPETVQNIAAAHISIELGLGGPNTTFSEAAIAGESALFYACELLRNNMVQAVLVTGADELTEPLFAGMKSLRILSKTQKIRPFDLMRDGMVLGEGACTLMLEKTDDAMKRGRHIYGEIVSFGFSSEPSDRLHYSSSEAMVKAINQTIIGGKPEMVIASANSTVELDYKEAIALKATVGDNVPVTALTSVTGFFMSSGVMKVGAALLCMHEGIIPPICGLEKPEVEGLCYMFETKEMKVSSALVNDFSHGGSNACVLLRG